MLLRVQSCCGSNSNDGEDADVSVYCVILYEMMIMRCWRQSQHSRRSFSMARHRAKILLHQSSKIEVGVERSTRTTRSWIFGVSFVRSRIILMVAVHGVRLDARSSFSSAPP